MCEAKGWQAKTVLEPLILTLHDDDNDNNDDDLIHTSRLTVPVMSEEDVNGQKKNADVYSKQHFLQPQ